MDQPGCDGQHLLVVDDDREICTLLFQYLGRHGFRVSTAFDGAAMMERLEQERIDLLVLDVMMPGEDGLALCRRLRTSPRWRSLPIIMLTAMGEETDRIVGLEVGADDYLGKPFNPRELVARVRAVLRRSGRAGEEPEASGGVARTGNGNGELPQAAESSAPGWAGKAGFSGRAGDEGVPPVRAPAGGRVLTFEGWRLDLATRSLRAPDGLLVQLSAGEFDLLVAFAEHPQRVLSRDQLLDLARGRTAIPFDRSIDVQVSRLRRKIEPDAQEPALIKTVRGGGYLFSPRVEGGG